MAEWKDKSTKIEALELKLSEAKVFNNEASNLSSKVAGLKREKTLYMEAIEASVRRESLLKEKLRVRDETLASREARMVQLKKRIEFHLKRVLQEQAINLPILIGCPIYRIGI
ncbi:hypothetical protein HAX54_003601 [Datura stramonium]|uniref:Uncharacterized protein n=1 Tax=Datura stramonium TaxID=4076 RepID=A0ABS8T6V3_DATST|nr:hypothetical protein [Datura stramonium]